MGSGRKPKRVPITDIRRHSMTDEGGPRISCPRKGLLTVEPDSHTRGSIGSTGVIRSFGPRLFFLAEGLKMDLGISDQIELLTSCIAAGYEYDGRLEMENGHVVVRYKRR